MRKTITGDFRTEDAMRNAMDDLLSVGIPREQLFMDTAQISLKVITPEATEREVNEILTRHQPIKLH
ncbi:hypothetical protein [Denitromonas iodatirespirans]|uniref:Uncharacterized protein n=1 Tax=Denitromonas iodatirespirans TaxID=2795389 RepID=A0A944HCB7_DENI1|nr:hypothetical protein [Denitromonas iodatirespirans]MBT0961046.1 hypothetical protein [Denitromonas iodatirespirans]